MNSSLSLHIYDDENPRRHCPEVLLFRRLGVCQQVSSCGPQSHHPPPPTSYSACGQPPPSVVAAISALSAAATSAPPPGCHGTTSPLDHQSNDQMTIFGLHPSAYSQSKRREIEDTGHKIRRSPDLDEIVVLFFSRSLPSFAY